MTARRASPPRSPARTGEKPLAIDAALEASPYPVIAFDAEGFKCAANRAACQYFGTTLSQLVEGDRARARSSEEAAFRRAHFPNWLSGKLYPARLSVLINGAAASFVLVPFPTGDGEGGVVVAYLAAALLGALLDRDLTAVASEAQRWIQRLSDGVATLADAAARPERAAERPADPGFAKLTRREWEIARRLAAGERVQLLGESLGISPNTVRNHLKSIYRKVGLRTQTDLVRRLKQHGL